MLLFFSIGKITGGVPGGFLGGGGLPSTNVKYSVENCGVHSATSLTIFTVCLTLFVKELEFNYFISNSIIINILIMFKNH